MRRDLLVLLSFLVMGLSAAAAESPAPSVAADPAHPDIGVPPKTAAPKVTTKPGLFTILEANGRTFFEIPDEMFGREMFWYAEVVEDPPETDGILGNSVGTAVVEFEQRDNVVYLRDLTDRTGARANFLRSAVGTATAPSSTAKLSPVRRALDAADLPPVVEAFPVVGTGPGGGAVIEVTKLFNSDMEAFSVAAALAADELGGRLLVGGVDTRRSYIDQTLSFPNSIHIRTLLTFTPPNALVQLSQVRARVSEAPLSVVVGHTIALLPAVPMKSRLFDDRVGFFATSFVDYDEADAAGARDRSIILRRRLEKKDPTQAVSEPVKPIIYHIGREVPEKWRPYIKAGVEDWLPAFEAAGFKNAIVVRDAPGREENPNWHQEDARWSVIRWVTEPIENAMGPNIHDPRSGEILSTHVLIWADVIKLAEQWYFTQAGGADERAASLPLDDELLGAVLRAFVTHEVGHSLGLRHNFKASQAFGIDQLRDPAFANIHGPVASIMSYGRTNFVAQPGDGVTRFLPKLGPYDAFAIAWGYKPIPDAPSPLAELPTLNMWANAQLDNPWLAFGGEDLAALFDPTVLTETVGRDRIAATRLGLMNLDRVASRLAQAASRPVENSDQISEMYMALLETRTGWIRDVAKLIGGVVEHRAEARAGTGPRFVPVPAERQRQAVAYLLDEGLEPPELFLDAGLLAAFAVADATGPVAEGQARILEALLSGRVYAMLHQQAMMDPGAYSIGELLDDVTGSVWAEVDQPGTAVPPLRRQLQRSYLDRLTAQLVSGAGIAEGDHFADARETGEIDEGPRGREREDVDTAALYLEPGFEPIRLGVQLSDNASGAIVILRSNGEGTDFVAVASGTLVELAARIEAALGWTEDDMTADHYQQALTRISAIDAAR
ncbi:MAG: zinc-dependent metalloprotease [Hyphomicrobiales bacterium]|nr:zinc-dependent metalloprotease [Hyphomicrobiales bacterium]